MVNSATGVALSASMRSAVSSGPWSSARWPTAARPARSTTAAGSTARRAPPAARPHAPRPCPAPACSCDSAMHSELVTNRSASTVQITGPAAAGPSSATSSGTPMKPVLGNAATSAPKAASFRPMRAFSDTAMVKPTTTSAHSTYTASTPGFSNSSTGVFMPKRTACRAARSTARRRSAPGWRFRAARRGARPVAGQHQGKERNGDEQDDIIQAKETMADLLARIHRFDRVEARA
jgi:hypothetical protein